MLCTSEKTHLLTAAAIICNDVISKQPLRCRKEREGKQKKSASLKVLLVLESHTSSDRSRRINRSRRIGSFFFFRILPVYPWRIPAIIATTSRAPPALSN